MVVCLCSGVTDRAIREAARAGVASLEELRTALGVAACCGQCADCARAVLGEARCSCELEPAVSAV